MRRIIDFRETESRDPPGRAPLDFRETDSRGLLVSAHLVRASRLNTVPVGRAWREDAACIQADPRLFDERPSLAPRKWGIPGELVEVAETFCRQCPVRRECAAEADANEYSGIAGGTYRSARRSGGYQRFNLLRPRSDSERVA